MRILVVLLVTFSISTAFAQELPTEKEETAKKLFVIIELWLKMLANIDTIYKPQATKE